MLSIKIYKNHRPLCITVNNLYIIAPTLRRLTEILYSNPKVSSRAFAQFCTAKDKLIEEIADKQNHA